MPYIFRYYGASGKIHISICHGIYIATNCSQIAAVTRAAFRVNITMKFRTSIHTRRQLISSRNDVVQMGNTSKSTNLAIDHTSLEI